MNIDELKDLHAKATPTWWEVQTGITPLDNHIYGTAKGSRGIRGKIASHMFPDDAALIVAMRNAMPELIAEIRRLKFAGNSLYIDACEQAAEDRDAALADLAQVKAERDVLIERIMVADCPYESCQEKPEGIIGCDACWRDWSAQEAAKRGGAN